MAAIFVSHSSRDNELARDVKSWLVAEGYEQVFLDFDKHTGLRAGEHWERRLYEEIERCHAVILILTANWLDSKWCFVEFTQARALGKLIFPIVSGPLGGALVAPEIQGVDLERWDQEGREHLAARIRSVGEEAARGFAWDRSRPPYPGIQAFDRDDAAIFFGRDPEVREVCERLEAHRVHASKRLVLILGASGSGKSSLLRAGVLPRLERERRRWLVAPVFRPERQPLTHLAKALAERAGAAERWRDWRAALGREHALPFLGSAIDDLRIGEARAASLLVPVDQFEEVFTIAEPDEREAFLALLGAITRGGSGLPILIVGTVLSDVMGEMLRSEEFACPFDGIPLRPMPVDRIPKVVEGPAGVHALSLERGLPTRIKADIDSPDALPLLAFALRELYDRFADGKRLSIADYERLGDRAAGLSPIENAVRRRAEDVLDLHRPSPAEIEALKEAFVYCLVRIREDGGFVRQPARLSDLPELARPILDRLVQARLLSRRVSPGETGADEPVVEVAHEALFRAWPLLDSWLGAEREFLAAKAQVGRALEEWRRTPPKQQAEALLSGLALKRAEQFLSSHPNGFTVDEAAFIKAGQRRERRRRRALAGLAGAAALLLVAAVAPRLYAEYGRRTALACDLYAAEEDNNVNVPGVPFDKIVASAAIPACETAVQADPDNPRLLHNLARSYDAGGRHAEAVAWYRKAVALGWAWSQNNLGVLTLYGRGTPPDFAAGVALLRAAFEQGNEQAAVNYAGTDFSVLVEDSDELIGILRAALVSRGVLAESSDARWTPTVQAGVEEFKRRVFLPDKGLTLRVMDSLAVVQALSDALARSRKG